MHDHAIPERLLPHLTASSHVLDVGCGHGELTHLLAAHVAGLGGQASQVVGVDLSFDSDATSHPTSPTTPDGTHTQPAFTEGSILDLPFINDSVDVILASQVLHHVTDPVAALRECSRVLRPGGIILARDLDFGAMTWYPPHPGLSRWRAVFTVAASLENMEPNGGRHLPTWCTKAGLDIEHVGGDLRTYGTPDSRAAFAEKWSDRVDEDRFRDKAARALDDPDGPTGAMATSAIEQMLAGWREWSETPGAVMTMPIIEVLARLPR